MKPLLFDDIKSNLYYITENGQIYSTAKKRFLIPQTDKDGYLQIELQRPSGGRDNKICKHIAPLVAKTYLGPPPPDLKDPTVNHIDGNILNNHYSNLEWLERGVNSSIRKNKGTGSKNHEAKLTEQEVYEICELLINTNLTFSQIGDKYGVKKSTISNIYKKRNWKQISESFDFSCRKTIRNEKGQFEVININLINGGK